MSEKVNKILITTDGSVAGGKAGYGYVVRDDENNRMIGKARGGIKEIDDIDQVEAIAVLQAVKYIDKKMKSGFISPDAKILLVSDSKRNEMIFTEGRIEPIEANVARWREIKFITKEWDFKLKWIKSHVSDLDRDQIGEDKFRQHTYNEMADTEAKKGRSLEGEKEEINEKGVVNIQEGYVDPNPILSSIKVDNSYPQIVQHGTIVNSANRDEDTWETHRTGKSKKSKGNYLSSYIAMKKESIRNNTPHQNENKNNNTKTNTTDFKSKLKVSRGRFNKNKDMQDDDMDDNFNHKGQKFK